MNKFAKRINKLLSSTKNCLVIGLDQDTIENLSTIFENVFILSRFQPARAKNIIYLEEIPSSFLLPEISAIVVPSEQIDSVFTLGSIFARCKPSVIILGPDQVNKSQNKSFLSMNYDISYNQKDTQHWKLRER